jgi:hypothetical protein
MKTLIRLAAVLVIAALSGVVSAQDPTSSTVMFKYNLNSLTETYCSLGTQFDISEGRVADATSTTMTAASGTPYDRVAVGDLITGTDLGGKSYINSVVARASNVSITINTPISPEVSPTLTNASIQARTLTCGTEPNSGAFDVSRYEGFTIQFDLQQLVLGNPGVSTIDSRILCRAGNQAQWLQVYPVLVPPAVTASYVSHAVTGGWAKEITGRFSQCRVGLKINAADDGGDTGTNSEQVTVSVQGVSK